MVFELLYERVAEDCQEFNILIALGTHPPMSMDAIYKRFDITEDDHRTRYPKADFHNHMWKDPDQVVDIGIIPKQWISEITDGMFDMDVVININKLVLESDLAVIVGPVFPHEVVGFSGGNKYLFPGVSGQEIIDFFHWLGALITNPVIIGNKWTPVRKVVDQAATLVSTDCRALCMVVKGTELNGLFHGTTEDAWSAAADLSNALHIEYHDTPFHTVLSCAPTMYDDLWTGGKCMYKIEPVVADGGKVIIYAPHITEVSTVHGDIIEPLGYHTRDYFLEQWDSFKEQPWGILAHSTHVKGIGSYKDGIEKPRIDVILATGISEEKCREINMGYMDPTTINVEDFKNREDEGILYVEKAGELLYRWKGAPAELGGSAS